MRIRGPGTVNARWGGGKGGGDKGRGGRGCLEGLERGEGGRGEGGRPRRERLILVTTYHSPPRGRPLHE